MRIGISSFTYSWNIGVNGYETSKNQFDEITLLNKCEELGVNILQIADNFPLEKLSQERLDNLAKLAQQKGVSIEAGTAGIKGINRYIEIAGQLNSPILRCLLHSKDFCPNISEAIDLIQKLLPELEKNKVILAIENHDYFHSLEIKHIIEMVNSPYVKARIDPVNNLSKRESTNDVFSSLLPHAINFHCKDYTVTRKKSMLGFDVEGAPVGDGLLDIVKCKKLLPNDISYIVELWTPWQGDIEKSCELESLWAKKSVEYLKSISNK